MNENLRKLAELIAIYAVEYGDFELSSGLKSSYFIDMSKVTLWSTGLSLIAEQIWGRIRQYGPFIDAIGGPSLGADPIVGAVLHSSMVGDPVRGFLVRKIPKNESYIEGLLQTNDKVFIVEDVVTTGNQTMNAIKRVEEVGAKVIGVIAVVDRLSGAKERLKDYNFQSLLTISDLNIS